MIYWIELPTGRTIPVDADCEKNAIQIFHILYPHKIISYVWDKQGGHKMKIECAGYCGRTLDIRTVRVLNWNIKEEAEYKEESVHILSPPIVLCKKCYEKMKVAQLNGEYGISRGCEKND